MLRSVESLYAVPTGSLFPLCLALAASSPPPPTEEGPDFVYLGFSPAEKPDAFPKRKPGSFYPKAFLGMSRRLTLPTTSSHGPTKACFRPRWYPIPTLSPKWHTAPHRASFYFTVFGKFYIWINLLSLFHVPQFLRCSAPLK